jgi:hypothetical protein
VFIDLFCLERFFVLMNYVNITKQTKYKMIGINSMKKMILAAALLLATVSNINAIEQDKICHWMAGALITKVAHDDFKVDYVGAGAITFIASCAKESNDRMNGKRFEWDDVAYTMAGFASAMWFDGFVIDIRKNYASVQYTIVFGGE